MVNLVIFVKRECGTCESCLDVPDHKSDYGMCQQENEWVLLDDKILAEECEYYEPRAELIPWEI